MRGSSQRIVAALIGFAAFAPLAARADDPPPHRPAAVVVPEPKGLWHGPLHGQTPTTLAGASVIDAPTVDKLVHDHAVFIDVANPDHRPPGLPSDMPYTPIHRSIPGATWMPGAGSGTDDPAFAKAFAARIDALTGGDKEKPVMAFCHPARWGSWNAAKRMTEMGYKHVYWFPQGAEGWQAYGQAADAEPDAIWKATMPKADAPQPTQ